MGEGKRDGGTGKKTLTLLSPVGGPPLTYNWPLQQLVRVSFILTFSKEQFLNICSFLDWFFMNRFIHLLIGNFWL